MVISENSGLQDSGICYNDHINQALVDTDKKLNEDQTMKSFKLKSSAQRQAKKDGIDKALWTKHIVQIDGRWVLYTAEELAAAEKSKKATEKAASTEKAAPAKKLIKKSAEKAAPAKKTIKKSAPTDKVAEKPKKAAPASEYVGTGVRGLTRGAARIAIEKPIGKFVSDLILKGLSNKEIYEEMVEEYGAQYAAGKKWYAGWYRHDMKKKGLI